VTIANPLGGEPLTVYTLDRTKQGLVDILDTSTINNARTQTYNGVEVSAQARLGGGRLVGRWTHDRSVAGRATWPSISFLSLFLSLFP
jgi:hypothetical protein